MLDRIGFNSVTENKGGTFTFARLMYLDAQSDPILIHTSNLPIFEEGYFVARETLITIPTYLWEWDYVSQRIDALIKFISPGTDLLGIWWDHENNVWELARTLHFTDEEKAREYARAYEQREIWDIENNWAITAYEDISA